MKGSLSQLENVLNSTLVNSNVNFDGVSIDSRTIKKSQEDLTSVGRSSKKSRVFTVNVKERKNPGSSLTSFPRRVHR